MPKVRAHQSLYDASRAWPQCNMHDEHDKLVHIHLSSVVQATRPILRFIWDTRTGGNTPPDVVNS